MDIFKGLTDDQKENIVIPALKELAMAKHAQFKPATESCNGFDDEDAIKHAIAWEYVCQNLGIPGFDWS